MSAPSNLKPGIKVGPQAEGLQNLIESQAKYAEIWYRVDWETRYNAIFEYISTNDIQAGLHFWGLLEGSLQPNLAYPNDKISAQTLQLMKQNIDVAAKHQANYVNVHVGNASLDEMNLDEHWLKTVPGSEVDMALAEQTAEKNILELHDYAEAQGVRLIVESIPSQDAEQWNDRSGRLHTHPSHALSNKFLERMGRQHGININNDISHTAAELITGSRKDLWFYLEERTKALAPSTVLVHCNTLMPPFNGTDSHNGILAEDFDSNVFPTREQFSDILKILARCGHNVWIIGEPTAKHVENYRALCDFLSRL